jgi:methylmalonyl-CoA mutase, C-terminal domain
VDERIRVVIAGPGPAAGDRLAELVARALRDAGVEVVYTDRPQTPEQLVATVVQEDADAVGVVVAGGDTTSVGRLTGLMAERGIDDVLLFAGGLDAGDVPGHGVARVFPRDASPAEVVDWLRERLRS